MRLLHVTAMSHKSWRRPDQSLVRGFPNFRLVYLQIPKLRQKKAMIVPPITDTKNISTTRVYKDLIIHAPQGDNQAHAPFRYENR